MRAHGYSLTFMSGDKYKDHVNKFVPHMLRSGIDGLIITSFSLNQDICSAVEHLIKMGHQKIALVTGSPASYTACERKKGYLRALEDYDIPVNPDYIIAENYANDFGYQAMQKLWNLPERPTAVFSANYTLCLGIYEAIYSLGIRIPEDLSVVSFDDFELSILLSPQLTAVRQPLADLAEQACDLLLRRMNGDYCDFPRTIRLKPECIYRDSVRNLFSDGK